MSERGRRMRKFWRWLLCLSGNHEWTCLAEWGVPPTVPDGDIFAGFRDYATPFCAHCGKRMTPPGTVYNQPGE